MGVFKEIPRADGSGTTTFYRLSPEERTVETTSTGGTEGMIDYNNMLNKPSINGVALVGDKDLEDLGIQPAGEYLTAVPEEYITDAELTSKDYASKSFVLDQINNIEHFSREVVDELPETGKSNVIYLVPKKNTGGDVYNEYIWTGSDYELIGTTAPDLTIFFTKEEVEEKLSHKVDKISGKQLSTNDYTTDEKTKLAGLNNYDDSELRNKVNALHNYDDTKVKTDILHLEERATSLETLTQNLDQEMNTKTTLVRLVKAGDSWRWQDAEGSSLSFTQAHDLLGREDALLVLEDIENDGKFMPLIYVSEADSIQAFFMNDDKTLHILVGNDNLNDTALGVFSTYNTDVATVAELNQIDGFHGEVRRVSSTNDFYIYDDNTGWLPFDKGASIDLSNYLAKNNTIAYAPTGDYNPATKRYVDTSISNLFIPSKVSQLTNDSNYVTKTTSVLDNYYTKTNTYTKREVEALIGTGGGSGTSDYNGLSNQPSINGVTLTGNKTAADLKLANIFQYSVMPTAGPTYEYQIAQYTGHSYTQSNSQGEPYMMGHFYVCTSYISLDGPGGWVWAELRVQDVDLSDYLSKQNYTEYTPTGNYNPATKKYVDDAIATVEVPTKTSELTNDSGFTTKTYVDSKIQIMTATDYANATKDPNVIYYIVG